MSAFQSCEVRSVASDHNLDSGIATLEDSSTRVNHSQTRPYKRLRQSDATADDNLVRGSISIFVFQIHLPKLL